MTVAETTINYMMVEKFSELLNERTGGKVTVDIYPGGQLGNTTEFTEAVIGGSIDMGSGMTTDLVDFIPQYAIFDMPNLFENVEQMRTVLQGDFTDRMNEFNNKGGIQMLGYSDAGDVYKRQYDKSAADDFKIIGVSQGTDKAQYTFVVSAGSGIATLEDFLKAAESKEMKLGVETGGTSHIMTGMFVKASGINAKYVEAGSDTEKMCIRDRTEYYVSEPQMTDNQHGTGACMMAVSEQLLRGRQDGKGDGACCN